MRESLVEQVKQLRAERDEAIRGECDRAVERDALQARVELLEGVCERLSLDQQRLAVHDDLRDALKVCRSFLVDPEGFAGVTISDTVWVRDGMTLLDLVEGTLLHTAALSRPEPQGGGK